MGSDERSRWRERQGEERKTGYPCALHTRRPHVKNQAGESKGKTWILTPFTLLLAF